MSMSQLDLFHATMNRRERDAFLFYASFTPDLEARVRADQNLPEDTDLRRHFGMFAPEYLALTGPAGPCEADFADYYADIDKPEGAYIDGNGVLHTPGSMYHFTHYIAPLRKAEGFEQLEAFPFLPADGFDETQAAEQVKGSHAEGRVTVGSVGHMYEDAWQIRDYEEFLMDMAVRPEWCEYILDRVTERNIATAEGFARAGADYLITGDDVANQNALMFSIEHWRHFMKSRWAKVYAAARAIKPDIQIWYHSDGNIESIIPELIEIGVTLLNPVQPECVDVPDIYRRFGDKLVLDGTLGTQTTMPFGSANDVRRDIDAVFSMADKTGGLILSPTHVLEPEVPLENIYAFIDAARSAAP